MAIVCCPDCGREWNLDEEKDKATAEMRDQLRIFVDAFDRAQGKTMTWVFDKSEIQIMRRFIEE